MMPCHYLIADRYGQSFVFERDPRGGTHVLPGREGPLVMTNHPLHRFPDRAAFPQPHDVQSVGTTSFDRSIHLEDAVAQTAGKHRVEDMEKACATVSVSRVLEWIPEPARQAIAASPGLSRTLWHVVYDAEARSMHIRFYAGETKKSDGTFDERYGELHAFALGA